MKKSKKNRSFVFELDGFLHRMEENRLTPLDRLQDLQGDTWLVTDFGEAMSRFMAVEGPVKYAEVLVRRKLQESGEFEEPVEIFTHWKKKKDKHSTDIFFTAVPTRLARVYMDELRLKPDHILVFALYSIMWEWVRRMGDKHPVAVVFRHDRFAEVLIGMRHQVYFANRCVAFDTQPEQIQTLWESVRADIEMVQRDQRMDVEKIYTIGWVDACEPPSWPQEWQTRTRPLDTPELMVEGELQAISLPVVASALPASKSISAPMEIALFFARQWAPALNITMAALLLILGAGGLFYYANAKGLTGRVDRLQHQMNRIKLEMAKLPVVGPEVNDRLKFLQTLDGIHRQPAYREVINDLTDPDFFMLQVKSMRVDYTTDTVRVELFGNIEAPFEEAHGRYKKFLERLTRRGYRIEENHFETRISTSQVVLKLIRPVL